MEKRFTPTCNSHCFRVITIPLEEFNRFDTEAEREDATVVVVYRNGKVLDAIAKNWVKSIADKLNEFDAANLATAKLI